MKKSAFVFVCVYMRECVVYVCCVCVCYLFVSSNDYKISHKTSIGIFYLLSSPLYKRKKHGASMLLSLLLFSSMFFKLNILLIFHSFCFFFSEWRDHYSKLCFFFNISCVLFYFLFISKVEKIEIIFRSSFLS